MPLIFIDEERGLGIEFDTISMVAGAWDNPQRPYQ